jgi:hypothetical protein
MRSLAKNKISYSLISKGIYRVDRGKAHERTQVMISRKEEPSRKI